MRTNEEIKKECLRRMKALDLHDEGEFTCVDDFRKTETPWKSEFHGILYWLDEEENNIVKNFENKYKDHKMKVYHCYKAHTEFGEILYMLFVEGDEESDSAQDFDEDLKNNIVFCYAHNITTPEFSEFGTTYIKSQFGGIVLK